MCEGKYVVCLARVVGECFLFPVPRGRRIGSLGRPEGCSRGCQACSRGGCKVSGEPRLSGPRFSVLPGTRAFVGIWAPGLQALVYVPHEVFRFRIWACRYDRPGN